MMFYRSLVVGLLGAIALLVAGRPPAPPAAAATPVEVAAPDAAVIDVSRSIAGADPLPFLGLRPGERVVEIDGVATSGVALAGRWDQTFPGEYLDIVATGSSGAVRRILVLVHP